MANSRVRNQVKAVVLANGMSSFVHNVRECIYAQKFSTAWDVFYAAHPQPEWTYKVAREAVVFGFRFDLLA